MLRRIATVPVRNHLQFDGESLIQKLETSDSHTKGGETLHIVNKGQTYAFKMETFRQKLRKLREKWNVDIRSLGEDRANLDEILQIMQWLYHDQKNYSKLLGEIREVFQGVKNPKPETVAARFIGCFDETSPSGILNKGCDPSCASSLPPPPDTQNYSPCDDMVLVFKDGTFVALNPKNTEHAYIAMRREDKFTEENIRRLKEAGIRRVTLDARSEDGNSRELRGPIDVDALSASDAPSTTEENVNSGWMITFIIVVILLFFLILSLLYYLGIFNR